MESRNRSSILVKRKESEVSGINCLSFLSVKFGWFDILKHKRFISFAVVMHDSSSYVLNVDMKYPRTARPRRCLFTKSPSAASWSWDVICPWSPPITTVATRAVASPYDTDSDNFKVFSLPLAANTSPTATEAWVWSFYDNNMVIFSIMGRIN